MSYLTGNFAVVTLFQQKVHLLQLLFSFFLTLNRINTVCEREILLFYFKCTLTVKQP